MAGSGTDSRRTFLKAAGLGAVGAASIADVAQAQPKPPAIVAREYWANKGAVRLNLYRKRIGTGSAPVVLLVHGSSMSGRPTFDLQAPGHDYSVMDSLARRGYDCWSLDCENYGYSSRTQTNSNIASGAADIAAVWPVIRKETGAARMNVYGESSGALRAGVFAMAEPEAIDRLVLGAFTYTGAGSPTLIERAKQLDFFRANNRRPRGEDLLASIFTRDNVKAADPVVIKALIDAEMKFGNTVPTGTYLDMCSILPVVDPLRIKAPTLLVRGEHDGIATDEDVLAFFRKLPNIDREFAFVPGAHALTLGIANPQLIRLIDGFFSLKPMQA